MVVFLDTPRRHVYIFAKAKQTKGKVRRNEKDTAVCRNEHSHHSDPEHRPEPSRRGQYPRRERRSQLDQPAYLRFRFRFRRFLHLPGHVQVVGEKTHRRPGYRIASERNGGLAAKHGQKTGHDRRHRHAGSGHLRRPGRQCLCHGHEQKFRPGGGEHRPAAHHASRGSGGGPGSRDQSRDQR